MRPYEWLNWPWLEIDKTVKQKEAQMSEKSAEVTMPSEDEIMAIAIESMQFDLKYNPPAKGSAEDATAHELLVGMIKKWRKQIQIDALKAAQAICINMWRVKGHVYLSDAADAIRAAMERVGKE